jgi:hypothetical protein
MKGGCRVTRSYAWSILFCAAVAPAIRAQTDPVEARGRWALGVSVGVSTFNAVSEGKDSEGTDLGFAPDRPTMWALGLSYGRQRLRVGIAARYGQAGIRAQARDEANAGAVIAPNALKLGAFSLALSTRLLRLRGGPSLRPSLAIGLERWTGAGSPTRTILGGQAGMTLEVVLTRAFVATLEGELGFTPASPFRKEDLPEGFKLLSAWRRTLAAGVYWRF